MPRVPTEQLISAITNAIERSSFSATLISSPNENPRVFVIEGEGQSQIIWVYIWSLTHGGGAARPQNEYRIQITGIIPPFNLNPFGPTLLIGYEPNLNCFAGFDIYKHLTFSTHSPSIQIPIDVLENSIELGLTLHEKGNQEIAIGVNPDQFLNYVLNASLLHNQGSMPNMTDLLNQVISLGESTPSVISQLDEDRQRVITEVSKFVRDSVFRKKVIEAYNFRCAVTGHQLNLIDAAHILPVSVAGSTDDITNGICLSPTYHRAFDRGLIYLNINYEMRINRRKENELVERNLSIGLDVFKSQIGNRILLPIEERNWPNIDMIIAANDLINIS
jgi:putative restriction endonuclease